MVLGTNYYMRLKNPEVYKDKLDNVLRDGLVPQDPNQEVTLIHEQMVHLAKCSWGWKPNFQSTPCSMPFDEQLGANDIYKIRSVKDIRDYYRTGDYEIVDEYGEVVSWEDFDKYVLHWGEHQMEVCEEREWDKFPLKSHVDLECGLGSYVDDEGYEFSTVCFC